MNNNLKNGQNPDFSEHFNKQDTWFDNRYMKGPKS